MRLPWKPRGDSGVLVTDKINLGEVDDRSRSYATTIERPDQYTPLDHNRAVFAADRETAMLMVVENAHRAVEGNSVDEYSSDFQDARINTARGGWDVAVDHEAAKRLHTTLGLMAVELENITRIQATLQSERQDVADLQASVDGWRSHLLGHSNHAPAAAQTVTTVSTPQLYSIAGGSTIADMLTATPNTPTKPTSDDQPGDDDTVAPAVTYMFEDKEAK